MTHLAVVGNENAILASNGNKISSSIDFRMPHELILHKFGKNKNEKGRLSLPTRHTRPAHSGRMNNVNRPWIPGDSET